MHHSSKEVLALSKREGGLNILDLELWNNAAYCGLVYKIAAKENTMWVKWTWAHNIKNKNFWNMKVPGECSWVWRNILYMRETAKKFIKYIVGNGETISLWNDPWCQGQLLCDNVEAINLLSFPPDATVSLLIDNGVWNRFVRDLPDCLLKRDILKTDIESYVNEDKIVWSPTSS
ncbi:hypothetical protein FRX31_012556, partial [Thalictrum thalictroides]